MLPKRRPSSWVSDCIGHHAQGHSQEGRSSHRDVRQSSWVSDYIGHHAQGHGQEGRCSQRDVKVHG